MRVLRQRCRMRTGASTVGVDLLGVILMGAISRAPVVLVITRERFPLSRAGGIWHVCYTVCLRNLSLSVELWSAVAALRLEMEM